jgi:hypothetical protein
MSKAERMLREIDRWEVNFDPASLPEAATDAWHVDDYRVPLAAEAPGEPVPGGPFAIARRLMTDYEFADPSMVRAHYDPDAPLLGRSMLLQIRFFAVHVHVGVRVSEIFDEVRDVDGRRARIWGWAYQTLGDHLERGQMDYQLWKWLDSGEVEFRIHAVSVLDRIRNPILSLGFRLIGRREQVLFARRCGARMRALVAAELEYGEAAHPAPERRGDLVVSPSGVDAASGSR